MPIFPDKTHRHLHSDMTAYDKTFDDIRPFTDQEAIAALPKAIRIPYLEQVIRYGLPDLTPEQLKSLIASCTCVRDFIEKAIYPAVQRLLDHTSEGVTFRGLGALDKDKGYLFLSNHRDIVMDSVILNYGLHIQGMPLAQSAIGNNLVPDENLLLISRINKNFVVRRDLSPRETLVFSQKLSRYIGYVLSQVGDSVWLAHREGRAKDGDDRTQAGVIKMLTLASRGGDLVDYLRSLRIVPMAISYQWDATDALKVRELLAKRSGMKYVKAPGEDLHSIITGITGCKGGICVAMGDALNEELEPLRTLNNDMQRIHAVCHLMDRHIHRLFHLFPTHYLAADLLEGTSRRKDRYSAADREAFEQRIHAVVAACGQDPEAREVLLRIYANPVFNREKTEENENE